MDYLFVRHYIYDLLRRSFIEEPSVEFLNFIQQEANAEILHQNFTDNSPCLQYYQACVKALKGKVFTNESEDFTDLHWDFTQLFIGPHELPAPPWESSYKNDRLLFGSTTNEVQQYYQQYYFQLDDKEYEAADHIGFELDFIYHLSDRAISLDLDQANSLKDNLAVQLNFIQQHLLSFMDSFANNVKQYALTDFYKNLAMFCATFVQFDVRELEKIINHLN